MNPLSFGVQEPTLGIDYGGRRVGLAVSIGFAPRPIDVLQHGEMESLIERILSVASAERVTRIVVGLPLHADGTEGDQAKTTREFAELLAMATSLPVLLWDERHTSQQAADQMISAGTSQKARHDKLDAVAAAMLLKDFFEHNGAGAERVAPQQPDNQNE